MKQINVFLCCMITPIIGLLVLYFINGYIGIIITSLGSIISVIIISTKYSETRSQKNQEVMKD